MAEINIVGGTNVIAFHILPNLEFNRIVVLMIFRPHGNDKRLKFTFRGDSSAGDKVRSERRDPTFSGRKRGNKNHFFRDTFWHPQYPFSNSFKPSSPILGVDFPVVK
jgi:hypothetical protein